MIDSEFILITCTCSGDAEAQSLSKELVNRRLAGCVQVVGPITSIYRWQGAVETAAEFLLLIKTTAHQFEPLRDCITELHAYDTPEIIAVPIVAGSAKYLDWLRGQIGASHDA